MPPTTLRQHWPDQPIFVIDDDLHWLTVMQRALKILGWQQIRTLSESRYAVQLASEFRPALVLLDLYMSEKDGHQVLHELRSLHPELPIIVVSSADHVDTAVACMREGADDFLSKPPSRQQLASTLDGVLRRRHVQSSSDKHKCLEDIIEDLDELPKVKEVPNLLVDEALRRSQGVVKDAASLIGISPQAICNRKRRAEPD